MGDGDEPAADAAATAATGMMERAAIQAGCH
jgi:hypothetical protein